MPRAKARRLGRPPSSMSAETRERIISAGRNCFAAQGYDKTTNKDIADAAGLTTGALYHYFDSKQRLFVAVLQEQQARVIGSFRQAAEGVDGAVAKLSAILDCAVELNAADPDLARFVSIAPIELDRHHEFVEELEANEQLTRTGGASDLFREIVLEGQADGEIDPDRDAAAVVNMLLAATSGLAQLAAMLGDEAAHRETVGAFKALLDGTLMPGSTAAAERKPPQRGRRRRIAS